MNNLVVETGEIAKPELTLEIIKKYICPLATDQECYMFLQLCRSQNLNPFLREAYLIKYGNSPATIVTGKETFTKRADRLPQYDGFKAGIIVLSSDKIVYREGGFYTSSETILGGWAEVYRKDRAIPFRNEIKIEEYEGKKSDGTPTKMWLEKRATMVRKVAIVQSLREAFPDAFGGLYSPEEINTIGELPSYEIGKPTIIEPPEKPKMPQSKSEQTPIGENVKTVTVDNEVITQIKKVTSSNGKNRTTGVEFTIYKVLGNDGIIYTTFDKAIADNVKAIKATEEESGETFLYKIKHEGGQYNRIKSIDIVEPPKPSLDDVDADDDFNDVADAAMKEVEEAGMGRG